MRIFKFLATFLIVVGLVYLFVFGLNWRVFTTVFTNQEALAEGSEWIEKTYSLAGMTDFIAQHPQHVSVVMIPLDTTKSSIQFEEQTPRAYASSGHIFHLLAYAEAVERGDISPDQLVSLEELNRFLIPGVEPNRHKESLRVLKVKEVIRDNMVQIDDLVRLMIFRNHQPSADFIYHTVGKERISALVAKHLGEKAEVPIPWYALHVAINLNPIDTDKLVTDNDRSAMMLVVDRIYDQVDTQNFTATDLLDESQRKGINYSFFEERYVYKHLPRVVPIEFAQFFKQVILAESVTEETRNIVVNHLDWTMENETVLKDFTQYGAVYDSRIAVSNGLSFGTSRYTGETYVSAVFFDQLPIGFWMHMSSNLINQDFQMRLVYDPALFEVTSLALNQERTTQQE